MTLDALIAQLQRLREENPGWRRVRVDGGPRREVSQAYLSADYDEHKNPTDYHIELD